MRKLLSLLVIALCTQLVVVAAPGDSTWVQANKTQMPYYGNYDTMVVFPPRGKTYRNIYMIFTNGKYVCPGSPTYCGDWDYTVQNFLITPSHGNFELGRLITPYASSGAPRTPENWTHRFVYDVTDYVSLLHDTATMRIAYSGYSGGFTADIKFLFIEGAPDREVLGIERLWEGTFGFGGSTSINTRFPSVTRVAPPFTQAAEMKFTVTGHGSDNNQCSEFCQKRYYVYHNGSVVDSYLVWRADCGSNQLSPQSGTWIYDRGNWCPGALVYSKNHKLPGIGAGVTSTVGLQFEPYTGSGGAVYTTEGTLFYYGKMKKTLDASMEQIISPTNDENHFRQNPVCGIPVVRVKNRGAATINSVTVYYGVQDSFMQSYTWTGRLATFEEADIVLPQLSKLNSIAGGTGLYRFTAEITEVNGSVDADRTNNKLASQFKAAPLWPSTFKINFKPNNERIAPGSNISETYWKIYDMDGRVVKENVSATINVQYSDTITLPTGCYKLELTDGSCDGLHWWVWDANPSAGINAGSFFVRRLPNTNINMDGYTYTGTYAHDFGCGFTQYFYVTNTTGVEEVIAGTEEITAFPNPAQDLVNIAISGLQQVHGKVQVFDALGRVVYEAACNTAAIQVDTKSFMNGMYTVVFTDNNTANRLSTRLMIAK